MKSFTSRSFREAFQGLPQPIQDRTRKAYRLFRANPSHPSLSFKKISVADNIYSVRVGLGYRALGQMDGAEIIWFWIGPHKEYDKRI